MKNEGALRMRFNRHVGIYRSDVSSLHVNPGRGSAFRSGPGQAIGRAGKNTPFPSSAMSSGRLFLDRVARQHCPSPLHRHHQNTAIAEKKGTDYHRTVSGVLTLCLTRGAHPTLCLMSVLSEESAEILSRTSNEPRSPSLIAAAANAEIAFRRVSRFTCSLSSPTSLLESPVVLVND